MSNEPTPKETDQLPGDATAPVETNLPNAEQPVAAPIIECPPELSQLARQEWDRIIGDITATGVIRKFDRAQLAIYCDAYARWTEAIEQLNRFGMVMRSQGGYPQQSP